MHCSTLFNKEMVSFNIFQKKIIHSMIITHLVLFLELKDSNLMCTVLYSSYL